MAICQMCQQGNHQRCESSVTCTCQCNDENNTYDLYDIAKKAIAFLGGLGLMYFFKDKKNTMVGDLVRNVGLTSVKHAVVKTVKVGEITSFRFRD